MTKKTIFEHEAFCLKKLLASLVLLVDALNAMGAQISYVKNEGYPPLKICIGIRKKRKNFQNSNANRTIIGCEIKENNTNEERNAAMVLC